MGQLLLFTPQLFLHAFGAEWDICSEATNYKLLKDALTVG
jgi:hypothetical protein